VFVVIYEEDVANLFKMKIGAVDTMKRENLSFISILSILLCIIALEPVMASFFEDTVHTVHVYFDDPDYWDELDETHTTEEYIMCSVVFDAVDTLDSVGIRLKGNSSYGIPGNKKPFHLKLDEYIEDRDYRGIERYSFNNGFKDPTFLREKLASEIFHGLGVPCPRVTWAEVYYNDDYWGFYDVVDPVDKIALSRFFGENDGNLYKGDPNGTFEWLGWIDTQYKLRYEKSTNETADDWTDLIEFCNFLNNSSDGDFPEIYDRMDVFNFARMWAANTFLSSLDSYQGSGHNYYFYFDADSVGHYIVWDMNEAFGVFQMGMSSSELRTMAVDWHSDNRPLAERLFEDSPLFGHLVDCAIHELLETTLDYSTFDARVTELADIVRPYVYADTNKMFTNTFFEINLDSDVGGGGPPPYGMSIPGLRDFVFDRGTYLASVIGSCDPVDVDGAVLINEVMADNDAVIPDGMGEYDDWFEIFNPADTSVDMSFWFASDDVTEPRKWIFPNGTIVPANGYLLVWADSDPEQGDYHTSFKLDADGEELAITGPDFYGNTLCDSVSWIDMPTDSSWGRYPNGSATWQICLEATPGAPNDWTFVVYDNSSLPGEFTFSAYPNPFNSAVRIKIEGLTGEKNENLDVGVFDITGRQIEYMEVTLPEINGDYGMDLTWRPERNIASGVYYIRVQTAEKSVTEKVTYLK